MSVSSDSADALSEAAGLALGRHLLDGRDTADLGQSLLAVLTVFVFWPAVPWWMALGWLTLFLLSTAARAAHRRQVVPEVEADGKRLLALLRRDVWLSTLLWGGWAILMVGADPEDLALLLLIVAGLVAAGTSTLVADETAFRGFMGFLLGPLALAVVLSGWSRDHLVFLLLIGLYGPFMLVVYRRAHALLEDQIRTSLRLRSSEAETARRRDFLNSLLSSAPTAVLVADHDGRVVRTNPALEEVLGFSAEEVRGQRLEDLLVGSVDGEEFRDFMAGVGAGERMVEEVRLRHRDGHRIWMRVSGTSAGGAAAGSLIFVGEDVSDQVAAREERERARVEAEQAARAKSAFLASMSHEIRTPLNGLLGMVELLLDSDLTEEQRESAEVVRSSGQGLLRILNDILDVSKIEAGQLDLETIDFRVQETVAAAARVFAGTAAARGLDLLVDVRPDVPSRAHGDPVRIRQILTNLLANAVKFTEEGEVVVTVERAGQTASGSQLRFSVRDTGMGIPPEKQSRIFEEFEQADTSTTRTHGGTGLGLTICKRLVELMGGEIGLDSTPGEGSEFHVVLELPRAGSEEETDGPEPRELEGVRCLVVDDNPTARRIVREALDHGGAEEVVECRGVDEALTSLRSAREDGRGFGVAVVDHRMPGRDGFDLARAVRREPGLDDLRVLMLTSAGASGAEAREAGIGAVLSKPAVRADILEALGRLLGTEGPLAPDRPVVTDRMVGGDRHGVRILLAEDNRVNQQVAVALLEKRGHEVVAVLDGAQAVEAVEMGHFDLVLMDIQMPVMDGLEATRAIRALERGRDLPVVALTAHAFAEERERTREAGMDDFLSKPFTPEDLLDLVDRWAAGRDAGAAKPRPPEDETPGGDGPPVDLEAFRAVMREAGVEEIVEATVEVFVTEAPRVMERMETALAGSDLEGVEKAAHSLKSSAGNIRASGLARLLERMENAARDGDVEAVERLAGEVRAEHRSVMAYLEGRQA